MAVAVDRDAVGLAVPGADRRLQVADIVVHFDLGLDPVGHFRCQALAADIAFEGRAHLDDVEVDRAGRDRLLQSRVVVGLGEVDPGDLGAGIGLPRLEEAAEEEVVQVLIVEAHEAQLDAAELALLDAGLGRPQAQLADLLPVGIRRLSPCRRPGFLRIWVRRLSSCARAGPVIVPNTPVAPSAEAAAAPFRTARRFNRKNPVINFKLHREVLPIMALYLSLPRGIGVALTKLGRCRQRNSRSIV